MPLVPGTLHRAERWWLWAACSSDGLPRASWVWKRTFKWKTKDNFYQKKKKKKRENIRSVVASNLTSLLQVHASWCGPPSVLPQDIVISGKLNLQTKGRRNRLPSYGDLIRWKVPLWKWAKLFLVFHLSLPCICGWQLYCPFASHGLYILPVARTLDCL